MSFELDPGHADRLRNLPFLRGLTEGRAQTRPAATGPGFRSHRLLRLADDALVEFLLALEPAGLSALESDAKSTPLRARLRLSLFGDETERFVALVLSLHELVPLRLSAVQEQASTPEDDFFALAPETATDAAMAAILRRCQHDLLRWLDLAWRELKPEAIHQTRVGLRRLRAALGLFKPLLTPALATDLNEEARWLGSMLAPTRDLDVFIAETLAPFQAQLRDDPGLEALTRRAAAARADSASALMEALRSRRCLALFTRLEISIERRIWRDQPVSETTAGLFAPLQNVAPGLLDRLWRTARRDAKHLQDGGPAAAHNLRKKIKKLRYSIEFIQCIGMKRDVRAFLAEVASLQQRLGSANDVAVAEELVARLCAGDDDRELNRIAGYIAGWSARGAADAPQDAAEGWRRLQETPKFWRMVSVAT